MHTDGDDETTHWNVISVAVSLLTLAVIVFARNSGGGPPSMGELILYVLLRAGGLLAAFILAMMAMFRGEKPAMLTLFSVLAPPLIGAVLFLRQ